MPFDIHSFRISSDGDFIVAAMSVFPDCDTIECSEARADAESTRKDTGVVYDRLFVRHWDAWSDGTKSHLFAIKIQDRTDIVGDIKDITWISMTGSIP